MKIERLVLGGVMTNCYAVCNTKIGKAVVVDPADDALSIKNTVSRHNCQVDKIILTHGHYDHFGGLVDLKQLYPEATVYAHTESKAVLGDVNVNLSLAIGGINAVYTADVCVTDGDKIPFGDGEFEVLYTPGHTIDSMCLRYDDVIFSGDTIFCRSVGRTDFPTGSMIDEVNSIKTKLMPLGDDIILYPGHGEYTTIGYERQNNPYLMG